ncbi:DUF6113 family protein [Cellulosimicrobium marinum]|uniref:DUF6113 family protein n=1 Tax=Cellulosimicrobium marinum TaxID=1638992 RepID=UPI001E2FC1A5|nr:DUF6113 family protein [Cellulosimicrobium marinum]MCB7136525.1 DUF6113 family protein [Cellulosimicrobium marinum]
MDTSTGRLVARAVTCGLVGSVVGLVGTVAHRAPVVDLRVLHLGLVLALLAVLAGGVLARAWSGLAGLVGYGVGWVAVVQLLALEGPGGDVLVPSQVVGYVWIYGGMLVVAVAAFLPRSWFSERPVRTALHERPAGQSGHQV